MPECEPKAGARSSHDADSGAASDCFRKALRGITFVIRKLDFRNSKIREWRLFRISIFVFRIHLVNLFFKREIRGNYSFSPAKIRCENRKWIARELRDENRVDAIMKLYNQVIRVFTPEAAGESCFARTTIGTWMSKLLPDLAAQRNFRSRPSGHISISSRCCSVTARPCSRGEKIISLSQRREPRSRFIHSFAKIRSAACAS